MMSLVLMHDNGRERGYYCEGAVGKLTRLFYPLGFNSQPPYIRAYFFLAVTVL